MNTKPDHTTVRKSIKHLYNICVAILDIWKLNHVDLIQINIEGDEYNILEQITDHDVLDRFKYIQVQFHMGMYNDVTRRNRIQEKLQIRGFNARFNYPFVWEGWEKINN